MLQDGIFYNGDGSIYDNKDIDAHGTHIAGVIAAEENGLGIVGVAPEVQIMPLKFFGEQGGYTSDVIAAIEYAKQMNVDVINCSFGGYGENVALKTAMAESGILFVTAAGNGNLNLDETPVYPASFDLDNVLVVSSFNNKGERAQNANYGSVVDIYAPGTDLYSTVCDGQYSYSGGSSQAAAFASGAAGLVLSANKNVTPKQLIESIRNSGSALVGDSTAKKLDVKSLLSKYENESAVFRTASGGVLPDYGTPLYEVLEFVQEGNNYSNLSISENNLLKATYLIDDEYFTNKEYQGEDLLKAANDLEQKISTTYSTDWLVKTNASDEQITFAVGGFDTYKNARTEIGTTAVYDTTSSGAIELNVESPILLKQEKISTDIVKITLDKSVSWRQMAYILEKNDVESIQPDFIIDTLAFDLKDFEDVFGWKQKIAFIENESFSNTLAKSSSGAKTSIQGLRISDELQQSIEYNFSSSNEHNDILQLIYGDDIQLRTSDMLKAIDLAEKNEVTRMIQNFKLNQIDYILRDKMFTSKIAYDVLKSDFELSADTSPAAADLEMLHYGEEGVNAGSGNYSRTSVDASLASPGHLLSFSRTYNSKQKGQNSILGMGWTFGFDGSITFDSGYANSDLHVVKVTLPSGSVSKFNSTNGADYSSFTAIDSTNVLYRELGTDNFNLVTNDGYTYSYTGKPSGKLRRITDPSGNAVTIEYGTAEGTVIKDSAGREYKLKYTSDNTKIAHIDMPNTEHDIAFSYNNNKLERVYYKDNNDLIERYEYYTDNSLKNVYNAENELIESITYDSNGKATKQVLYNNLVRFFKPDPSNTSTKLIEEYDLTVSSNQDFNNRTPDRVVKKTYDSSYYVTQTQYPNNEILKAKYSYIGFNWQDYTGNSHSQSTNTGDLLEFTDANGNVYIYSYNSRGNVTTVKNPDGGLSVIDYDLSHNSYGKSYYASIREIDELGVSDEVRRSGAFAFQTLKSKSGASVYHSITSTDSKKKLEGVSSTHNLAAFDIKQLSYTDVNTNVNGLVMKDLQKKVVDENFNSIEYDYDSYGNVIKETVTSTDATHTKPIVIYTENDSFGNVIYKSYHPLTDATLKEKAFEFNEYDENHNLIRQRVIDKDGNTGYTRYVYDALGRPIQEIEPYQYDTIKESNLADLKNSTYNDDTVGYRYEYNLSGELTKKTDPMGNVYSYSYDAFGNVTKEVSPDGSIKTYTYDALDRIKTVHHKENESDTGFKQKELIYSVINSGSTATANKYQVEERRYTNEAGTEYTKTTSVYNFRDQLLKATYNDETYEENSYLENGLLDYSISTLGAKSYYDYDHRNRMIAKWIEVDSGKYTYEGYEYYGNDLIKSNSTSKTIISVAGRPSVKNNNVPSDLVTYTFTYNALGEVVTERIISKNPELSNQLLIENFYLDSRGFLTEVRKYHSTAGYTSICYEYDDYGRVTGVINKVRKGDLEGYDFNLNDLVDVKTNNTYDFAGNLTKSTVTHGSYTRSFEHKYDYLNNQTKVTNGGAITNIAYDHLGNVVTSEDPNNNQTYNNYDGRGNLLVKEITGDSTKQSSTVLDLYDYDVAGRMIKEVRVEKNQLVTFLNSKDVSDVVDFKTIDSETLESYINILETNVAQYPNLKITKFAYNDMDQITTVTLVYSDNEGKKYQIEDSSNTYYTNGLLKSEQDALGNKTEYTYDLLGRVLTVKDPETSKRGLSYTGKNEYDGHGNKTKVFNAKGHSTKYVYNDFDQKTETYHVEKLANGTYKETKLESATYDYLGHALTVTDGENRTITCKYNAFGKIKSRIYPGDDTIVSFTENYQYNPMGQVGKVSDSEGKVIVYSYNDRGNQESIELSKTGESEKYKSSSEFDYNGNILKSFDANNNRMEYAYDTQNRLYKKTAFLMENGVESKRISTTTYDINGNVISEKGYINDKLVSEVTHEYDALGRLVKSKDADDQLIEKRVYDDAHRQTHGYDALGYYTEFEYDANSRVTYSYSKYDTDKTDASKANNEANRSKTVKVYDDLGNLVTTTDGLGNETTYVYDSRNRLEKVIDALGNETTYTYDETDKILTQKDGRNLVTTMAYNVRGDLKKRIDPENREESFTYYPDGKLKSHLDREKNTITYAYHVLGKVLTETVTLENGKEDSKITYEYDNVGNLKTMNDKSGQTTYTYDELNRVLTKKAPGFEQVMYEYDLLTDLSNAPLASGQTATKEQLGSTPPVLRVFDKVGRLLKVVENGQTTTYEYDIRGNKSKVTYQSGAHEDFTYTPNSKVETLKNYDASNSLISEFIYTYDANGHQKTLKDKRGTTAFYYDKIGRLQRVVEPDTETAYGYDASGNRRLEAKTNGNGAVIREFHYENEQKQPVSRLMKTTTEQMGGFQSVRKLTVEIKDQDNIYNGKNQLVKTMVDGKTVENVYNGLGLRVSKSVDGKTTNYLYSGMNVIAESNSSGTLTARNIHGSTIISRELLEGEDKGEKLNYFFNGSGDIVMLVNTAGVKKAEYRYDVFGNPLENVGKVDNPYRYASYQYDEETDMYYLNARMYDAKLARFMQEDTYRGNRLDPLSLNLYTYTHNDPINYYDPTGHSKESNGWNYEEEYKKYIEKVQRTLGVEVTGKKDAATDRAVKKHCEENRKRKEEKERKEKKEKKSSGGSSGGWKAPTHEENERKYKEYIKNVQRLVGDEVTGIRTEKTDALVRIYNERKRIDENMKNLRNQSASITAGGSGGSIKDTKKPFVTAINGEVFPAHYVVVDGKKIAWVDEEYWDAWEAASKTQMSGHATLDVLGLVPIAGGFADLVNGIWYTMEGDKLNAAFSMAAILPISEYGSFVAKYGDEAAAAVKWVDEVIEGTSKFIDPKLMDELAASGVKYNPDAVQMVTKNQDGVLMWLETGSESAGLTHIMKHEADLLAKGVDVTDIPGFIKNDILSQVPTLVGRNAKGPYAEYLVNGQKFRLAYGDNGFIVSLFPIK